MIFMVVQNKNEDMMAVAAEQRRLGLGTFLNLNSWPSEWLSESRTIRVSAADISRRGFRVRDTRSVREYKKEILSHSKG